MSRGHVGICVREMEEASHWFADLGYEPVFKVYREEPFLGMIVGQAGAAARIWHLERLFPLLGPRIELLEYDRKLASSSTDPIAYGNGHVALSISDLEKTIEKMAVIGIGKVPDGPNEGDKVAYVYGPSGFVVELIESK